MKPCGANANYTNKNLPRDFVQFDKISVIRIKNLQLKIQNNGKVN